MKATKEHIGQQVLVASSPQGEFYPGTRTLLAVLDTPFNGCTYVVSSMSGKGARIFPVAEPFVKSFSDLKPFHFATGFAKHHGLEEVKCTITFGKSPEQHYLDAHKASGLKPGDYVRVTRCPDSYEDGWSTVWVEGMEKNVGNVFKISGDAGTRGFILKNDNSYAVGYFPYFVLEKVDPQAEYLKGHDASGLKIGDYVRVTRKAETHEQGWGNSWVPEMSNFIGSVFKIGQDRRREGFHLEKENHFLSFPYFVLEKVTDHKVIHAFCNIGIGDWVRVTRAWEKGEFGYLNPMPEGKKPHVGKVFRVRSVDNVYKEIRLETGDGFYLFPAFVLEKVPTPRNPTMLTEFGKTVVEDKTGNRALLVGKAQVGPDYLPVIKYCFYESKPFLSDYKKLYLVD